jgi:hypothetical protein
VRQTSAKEDEMSTRTAEATHYVQYVATASINVPVTVPEGTVAEDVDEVARELADEAFQGVDMTLCHHCAAKMDLSEFEQDNQPDAVWTV